MTTKIKDTSKKLKITLVRGKAGSTQRQRKVLESLGLGKTGSVVYHDDQATILGMIDKVSHMVKVEDNK